MRGPLQALRPRIILTFYSRPWSSVKISHRTYRMRSSLIGTTGPVRGQVGLIEGLLARRLWSRPYGDRTRPLRADKKHRTVVLLCTVSTRSILHDQTSTQTRPVLFAVKVIVFTGATGEASAPVCKRGSRVRGHVLFRCLAPRQAPVFQVSGRMRRPPAAETCSPVCRPTFTAGMPVPFRSTGPERSVCLLCSTLFWGVLSATRSQTVAVLLRKRPTIPDIWTIP